MTQTTKGAVIKDERAMFVRSVQMLAFLCRTETKRLDDETLKALTEVEDRLVSLGLSVRNADGELSATDSAFTEARAATTSEVAQALQTGSPAEGEWSETEDLADGRTLRHEDDEQTKPVAPTAEQAEVVPVEQLQAEIDRLNAIINTPQSGDFLRAVSIEAEHQRQRWGAEGDAGKTPADWFWLVGYLGGKALHAHAADNVAKAEHHIITTAAALANWHLNMFGKTNMRPGVALAATAPSTGEREVGDGL